MTLLRQTNEDLESALRARDSLRQKQTVPGTGGFWLNVDENLPTLVWCERCVRLAIRCGEALLAQHYIGVVWLAEDVETFERLRERAKAVLDLSAAAG